GDDVAEAVVTGTGKGRRGARDSEVCPCTGHGRERRAPVGRAAPDAARARQAAPQPRAEGTLDAAADEPDHGAGPVSSLFLAAFERGEPRPVGRARIDEREWEGEPPRHRGATRRACTAPRPPRVQ